MNKYNDLKKIIGNRKTIALFGSSLITDEYPELTFWDDILDEISVESTVLLTGGYSGSMSFFSKRFKNKGGLSFGITCEIVTDKIPNNCYSKTFPLKTPFERLEALTSLADLYIVVPGGIGTMVEVSTALWLIDRDFISPRKILLLGSDWKDWLNWFKNLPFTLRGNTPIEEIIIPFTNKKNFKLILRQEIKKLKK